MKKRRIEHIFSVLLVIVAVISVTAVVVTWRLMSSSNQYPHETVDDLSAPNETTVNSSAPYETTDHSSVHTTNTTTGSSASTSLISLTTTTESRESSTSTVPPTSKPKQSSKKTTTKPPATRPKVKGAVAITFDDGPTKHTARLLDALKKYDAKVTFFLLGQNVSNNKALIQRMIDEGHEVANHSYSHPDLRKLSDAEVISQLRKTNNAISAITGKNPKLLRPPYGAFNRHVTDLAKQEGLALVLWTPSPQDWKYRDVDYVYNYILKNVKAGSTLLLHDTYRTSVDGFIKALPVLVDRGLKFVTVSELVDLKAGDVHPASWAK